MAKAINNQSSEMLFQGVTTVTRPRQEPDITVNKSMVLMIISGAHSPLQEKALETELYRFCNFNSFIFISVSGCLYVNTCSYPAEKDATLLSSLQAAFCVQPPAQLHTVLPMKGQNYLLFKTMMYTEIKHN